MKVWFFVEDGQRQGPFSIDELAQRSIARQTLVWKEGMLDWIAAADVPELLSLVTRVPPGIPVPPAIPATMAATAGRPGSPRHASVVPAVKAPAVRLRDRCRLWMTLYIVSWVGVFLVVVLETMAPSATMLIAAIVVPLAITTNVIGCIQLYGLWAALQPHGARTTPGKAVGYLFIPLASFYWQFVAFRGLLLDTCRAMDSTGCTGPRPKVVLATLTCVFVLLCWIPLAGQLMLAAAFVMCPIWLRQATHGVIEVLERAPDAGQGGRTE